MNWKCDIVTDLAPLYYDGAASEASRRLIREHLRRCKDCRGYYRHARASKRAHGQLPVSLEAGEFAVLARRVLVRRILMAVAVFSYVGATLGVFLLRLLRRQDGR